MENMKIVVPQNNNFTLCFVISLSFYIILCCISKQYLIIFLVVNVLQYFRNKFILYPTGTVTLEKYVTQYWQ